jgi:hypothetical protein
MIEPDPDAHTHRTHKKDHLSIEHAILGLASGPLVQRFPYIVLCWRQIVSTFNTSILQSFAILSPAIKMARSNTWSWLRAFNIGAALLMAVLFMGMVANAEESETKDTGISGPGQSQCDHNTRRQHADLVIAQSSVSTWELRTAVWAS